MSVNADETQSFDEGAHVLNHPQISHTEKASLAKIVIHSTEIIVGLILLIMVSISLEKISERTTEINHLQERVHQLTEKLSKNENKIEIFDTKYAAFLDMYKNFTENYSQLAGLQQAVDTHTIAIESIQTQIQKVMCNLALDHSQL